MLPANFTEYPQCKGLSCASTSSQSEVRAGGLVGAHHSRIEDAGGGTEERGLLTGGMVSGVGLGTSTVPRYPRIIRC